MDGREPGRAGCGGRGARRGDPPLNHAGSYSRHRASAGLGAEFARQLAARGLDLLLVARREERLKELAGELGSQHGVRIDVLAADLAEPTASARIEAHAAEQGLRIDWLINNAGVAYLVALSEELALVLRGSGVHVSALCPGFTHTEFHEAARIYRWLDPLAQFVWLRPLLKALAPGR